MIRINGLTKIYSRSRAPAIKDVSFTVPDGEIVGFVGLNGAGKSTTIRVSSGLSSPTYGRVTVDGYDIVEKKVQASWCLGWVPELPNFEPNARAESLMKYFAGFYGIRGDPADERSSSLLRDVGLDGSERLRLREYSQGMRKRFALAASMLGDPQNYLFDEVLNGLDPEGIRFFRKLVFSLRERGKAVLLSSHILAEVESISDKVVVIHKGRVIKNLEKADLENLASHRETLEDYFLGLVQEPGN